jgi:hypothetical protein
MSCGITDRACMEQATTDTIHRLTNNKSEDFDALTTAIAAGRHTPKHTALDSGDIDYIVSQSADISWLARPLVRSEMMSFFDIAPKNGSISEAEWRDGVARKRASNGVQLRAQ